MKKIFTSGNNLVWNYEINRKFTRPGDTIIDPFFGSGSLGEAAIKLNRQFIGIEIDPKTLDTAEKRLERVGKKIVLPSHSRFKSWRGPSEWVGGTKKRQR